MFKNEKTLRICLHHFWVYAAQISLNKTYPDFPFKAIICISRSSDLLRTLISCESLLCAMLSKYCQFQAFLRRLRRTLVCLTLRCSIFEQSTQTFWEMFTYLDWRNCLLLKWININITLVKCSQLCLIISSPILRIMISVCVREWVPPNNATY